MNLEKYSIGIGDRFGREGVAQLRALEKASSHPRAPVPVWNKSFREHSLLGTTPDDVRVEADLAVREVGWKGAYYVDADHVGIRTVDGFLKASDFFTIDVADFIGAPAEEEAVASFVREMAPFVGLLRVPGLEPTYEVTPAALTKIGRHYANAVAEAGRIYRHIAAAKGENAFVVEVSTDEAADPQLPFELFFILGALAHERVPVQTIAPKFSGKFLKGIDYVGDTQQFEREFEADVLVIEHAKRVFGLPASLKVSVHTGSDKFSLYPAMRRALLRHDAGLHLKTAGTTWLEEVIGVALSGGEGLGVAKRIYSRAHARIDELCKPYATVVEIDRALLPAPLVVEGWSAEQFVRRLRHEPSCPDYSVHVRQLMHVAFKIAAEMGAEFRHALDAARETAGRCVTDNLFERHIRPLFVGS
jgi:hypothetical protein